MSHAIDLALMGLAATSQRWQLVTLAVLLIVVRRSRFVCKGLLALPEGWPWYRPAWQPSPLLAVLLPGVGIMSSAGGSDRGSPVVPNRAEPAVLGVVPPDTNAARTSSAAFFADQAACATGHKLSADEVIELLAAHTDYSANKIADLVGGQRAATLAKIGTYRKPLTSAPPARSVSRPEGGW